MKSSIAFHLNGESVQLDNDTGGVVVDWLRHERGLTGTKEGCREGDCGACLVLLGGARPADGVADAVEWLAVPSCLLALGELDGRHLVTIEGLAAAGPTPVMRALHGEGASQCGFCSPGIVVALTAFLLGPGPHDAASAMAAVDGNLCRCTGYASIRRAAASLVDDFAALPTHFPARLASLAAAGVVPPALAAAMGEDAEKAAEAGAEKVAAQGLASKSSSDATPVLLGGGTDYFVRNPDPIATTAPVFSDRNTALRHIARIDENLEIGAAVTAREFFASALVRAAVPGIERYERLVASAPIRARATLAGNIANASPVGDMTAMIIALGGRLRLRGRAGWRELPLERFFLSYKKIDLRSDESIEAIVFRAQEAGAKRFFSFEKASKRANLDIASVNSALSCTVECADEQGAGFGILRGVRLSAGGVGPIPLFFAEASAFLEGKRPEAGTVRRAAEIAAASCEPQSDVRGSASYRSALVKRFVYAHFMRMAPDSGLAEELFP
jgi:xanthine dehydrogenase small subunit